MVWSNGTTGANEADAKTNAYPSLAEGYPYPSEFSNSAVDQGNSRAAYARVIDAAQKGDVLRFSNEELKDEILVDKLSEAAARGVDVRINMSLPYGYDPTNPSASASNLWGVWEVVRAGATAHMFTNDGQDPDALYIHGKFVSLNDSQLFVGSENASTTSLTENRELGINLGAGDQAAIDTIIGAFDKDWAADPSWLTVWTPQDVPAEKPSKKMIQDSVAEPYLSSELQLTGIDFSDTPQTCGPVTAPAGNS